MAPPRLSLSQHDRRRLPAVLVVLCLVGSAVALAAEGAPAAAVVAVGLSTVIGALLVTALDLRAASRLSRAADAGATHLEDALENLVQLQDEIARSTSEQSSAVAETTATVEELAAAASSIAEGAGNVAAAAERTVETMVEMEETVERIADRSRELGTRSDAIGQVVGLINGIAEQTNLLALNASIEAARAGQAGKGFAVVANEVRRLAERSVESTTSIRDSISAIQAEVASTVLATERGAGQATDVSSLMRETTAMLDQSLLATQQQQSAAEQVAIAMNEIRSASEGLTSERDKNIDASGYMRAQAEALRSVPGLPAPRQALLLAATLGCMGGALSVAATGINIVATALLGFAGAASFVTGVALARRRIAKLAQVVASGAEFFNLGASAARKSHARMATTTAQQSSSVVETTATVMELTAAARSIAENAAASSLAAERTASTMEEMEATVAAIADRSQTLGERSRAIDDVLGLINEIAEQTSLLSLNAAIEAARAGEAGKGFAVVAAEVRKLAERAVGSVESIRGLVAAIQVETTATVLATEQGTRQARTVLELMGETASLLEQSLLATQQQQSAAEQVAAAMTQIQTGAEAIVAACAERANDAADFERLGNELRAALAEADRKLGPATARA